MDNEIKSSDSQWIEPYVLLIILMINFTCVHVSHKSHAITPACGEAASMMIHALKKHLFHILNTFASDMDLSKRKNFKASTVKSSGRSDLISHTICSLNPLKMPSKRSQYCMWAQ